jgi:hypothetical protein
MLDAQEDQNLTDLSFGRLSLGEGTQSGAEIERRKKKNKSKEEKKHKKNSGKRQVELSCAV